MYRLFDMYRSLETNESDTEELNMVNDLDEHMEDNRPSDFSLALDQSRQQVTELLERQRGVAPEKTDRVH